MESKLTLPAVVVAGFVLTGCVATGSKSASSPSTENARVSAAQKKVVYTAELGLTPRQRFTKALEKLENGEHEQALAELNAYLKNVPNSNSARNLIEQITTESSQYFPAEFFKVNLSSGTSLSTLAKKYLGSALKFYALAKYNDISNPSRVNIGQEIKIPLTQLARIQREKDKQPKEAPPVKNDEIAADALTTESDKAVESDEVATEQAAPVENAEAETATPQAPEVTALSVVNDLKALIQQQDYSAAVEKLTQLKTFGPLSKEAQDLALTVFTASAKELSATDPVKAAEHYSEAGQLNLNNGDNFAAFTTFKLATDLDEDNQYAMEEMLILQKEIADKYHREASSAFRRQELDVAIAKWDKVLEVNPDHSSAKLYRTQAIELKERLDKIKKN